MLLLPFAGCAVGPAHYQETHELERLTVIFMDEKKRSPSRPTQTLPNV